MTGKFNKVLAGNLRGLTFVSCRKLFREKFKKNGNVLTSVSQRRDMNFGNVNTIIEIFPKISLIDRFDPSLSSFQAPDMLKLIEVIAALEKRFIALCNHEFG